MKRERIYIAGPYSGDTKAHLNQATQALIAVMRKGHFAHCPHTHTDCLHGLFEYEDFMALDFDYIKSWATALLYLSPSPGADRELAMARSRGLTVYMSIDDIADLRGDSR